MSFTVLVLGCFVWIPIAVWVVSIVHWMVQGDVDFATGIAGIFVGLALGWLTFKPPVPGLAPFSFLAVLITVVGYPFVRSGMDVRQLKNIEVDGIEDGYRLIGQRPNNPVARLKIAKHLYALGYYGHAIAVADTVMPSLPERSFLDEHRMVRGWKANPPHASAYRNLPCVECGHMNPPGAIHCQNCGEPFLLHVVQGKFVPRQSGRKLLALWIALVALLAGIPASTALPPPEAIAAIIALMLLGCAMVFAAFYDGKREEA